MRQQITPFNQANNQASQVTLKSFKKKYKRDYRNNISHEFRACR